MQKPLELLEELDAATLPVVGVCLRIHTELSGSEIASAAWAALASIDKTRESLRVYIAAQPEPASVARWDGSKRKGA